jgi:hypothetical protein
MYWYRLEIKMGLKKIFAKSQGILLGNGAINATP